MADIRENVKEKTRKLTKADLLFKTQQIHDEFLLKQKENAESANIPVWVQEMVEQSTKRLPYGASPLSVQVDIYGNGYYKNSLGRKVELPRESNQMGLINGALLKDQLKHWGVDMS